MRIDVRRRAVAAALAALLSNAAAAQDAKVFPIRLQDGKAADKAVTIKVSRGDALVLRWQSDRAIALHLHGYDIEQHVPPAVATDMAVKATVAGRFPITEHAQGRSHHHRPIAYLEVHP